MITSSHLELSKIQTYLWMGKKDHDNSHTNVQREHFAPDNAKLRGTLTHFCVGCMDIGSLGPSAQGHVVEP